VVGILVLSDTHVKRSAELPEAVLSLARRADLVIHAGDLTHGDIISELRKLTEVAAVKGNMDFFAFSIDLPKQREIEIEGVKIGVVHSSGSPNQTLDRAKSAFSDRDVIIFGHSHQYFLKDIGGVVMFNPGSPTDHRFAPFPTYGWLQIDARRFTAAVHRLDGEVVETLKGCARRQSD